MISYKPLLRLLLERDMSKTELREVIGFSTTTLAKISKNEYISMETLEKICKHLNCKVENIIEFIDKQLNNIYKNRKLLCRIWRLSFI